MAELVQELEDPCIVLCSVGDGPKKVYFHWAGEMLG
jgi:hypothetical protein